MSGKMKITSSTIAARVLLVYVDQDKKNNTSKVIFNELRRSEGVLSFPSLVEFTMTGDAGMVKMLFPDLHKTFDAGARSYTITLTPDPIEPEISAPTSLPKQAADS